VTTTNDELKLAGDIDAQQANPEEDFDINQPHPEATQSGIEIDASDVVSLAKAVSAGVPIGKLVEDQQATQLTTHTWTPGAACPMRSHNRKVGSLVGVYNLKHPANTIRVPSYVTGVNWLARCETHQADFYTTTFGPAWKARNRPWEFCPSCESIFNTKHGGKAAQKGKKAGTVKVETPAPKVKAEPKAKVKKLKGEANGKATLETATPVQAQEPQGAAWTPVAPADDPEEAVWNTWSQSLAKVIPAGARVDWVSDYHYRVVLKDNREIDLMVHKDTATFRHRDSTGHDHYADDIQSMLAEIG
jgi:hypothetical protein